MEVADGKALIVITASCSSTGKVAEGSRHMEDSSIIHYAPLSHFEMVTEIKHISV